ncbi:MAG: ribosomal protein S19 family protein [Candidatus Marsarchaeota archaeon]|nr:ribosomal protein S19 family protein [Candidatus Marsarchaeota archaeon]
MVERIAFKGKIQSELSSLKFEDYLKMIKSRQRRSIKRNSITYKALIEKVEKARKSGFKKPIRTHVREAVILPSWLGIKFEVHNGKEFVPIEITGYMLGHRLGEYAFTTKRVQHSAPGIRATKGSKFLAVK